MIRQGRPNLQLLQKELTDAGIIVNGLGCYGLDYEDTKVYVHTYSTTGDIVDLPDEASSYVMTHVAPAPPQKIDLGADVAADQDDRMADTVQTLRTYLAVTTPTAAQSAGALKLLIRVVLYLLKHRLGY